MKIRTGLFFLVAGSVVPVLLLAIWMGLLLIDHEQETFRRGAIDRNRAFFSAVDAAINGHVATLKALSTSSNLMTGNTVAFERRLARILDSQPDWEDVILTAPDGSRLLDAAHPARSHGETADLESLRRAVATAKPAVGSVVKREPGGRYGIAIRYPVHRGRELVYVLTAIVRPEHFQRLLEAQQLPEGWACAVVDRSFHFVARVPYRDSGETASPDFRMQVSRAEEGWYRGRTVEGHDSFTAFLRSPASGWSIGLAIPAKVVNASSRRAAWTLGAGTLAAIALALVFALVAGRRIAIPIATIAAAARRLGARGGAPVPTPRAPFRELRDVQHALEETSAAIAERQALREREQAALREADRAKDEFIAVLGHELRNPLSAIASSVHLQRVAEEGSPAAASAREIIERQTRQMIRLVEDLMDISRLATGKLTLKRERLDLADLAGRLVDTWSRSKRIAPDRVVLDLEPAWVDADRARMEQVIANLLDNASKFSPDSSPIALRVRARDGEAVLVVQDRGAGMEAAMIEQAFKPFVQGPQDAHRPTGGLGLGLSVVQRLVELHGGRVEAASEGRDRGTTFTVRLPLAADQAL